MARDHPVAVGELGGVAELVEADAHEHPAIARRGHDATEFVVLVGDDDTRTTGHLHGPGSDTAGTRVIGDRRHDAEAVLAAHGTAQKVDLDTAREHLVAVGAGGAGAQRVPVGVVGGLGALGLAHTEPFLHHDATGAVVGRAQDGTRAELFGHHATRLVEPLRRCGLAGK